MLELTLLNRLFDPTCDDRLKFWLRLHNPDSRHNIRTTKWIQRELCQKRPLYYSSLLGFTHLTEWILQTGADINANGGLCGNALQAASINGHQKVVQLLVDKGVDVNAEGGCYGSALAAALGQRNEELVRLLLENGANPNGGESRDGGSERNFDSGESEYSNIRCRISNSVTPIRVESADFHRIFEYCDEYSAEKSGLSNLNQDLWISVEPESML